MKNKIFLYIVSFLCMCSILIRPLAVSAYYGTVTDWNGSFSFQDDKTVTFLRGVFTNYSDSSIHEYASGSRISYEGTESNMLRLDGLTPGHILNGCFTVYGTAEVNFSTVTDPNNYMQRTQLNITSDISDAVVLSCSSRESTATTYDFTITVSFNGFYCNSDHIDIPFEIGIQTSVGYYNIPGGSLSVPAEFDVYFSYATDWAGDLMEYSDLRDVPSLQGYFANQNQDIADAITDHTDSVGSKFSALTVNLRNWYQALKTSIENGFSSLLEQMTEEQDEQLHGYEGNAASNADSAFNAGSSELTTIEGDLADTSSTYVNEFTTSGFDTSVLSTLGNSLLFVVTWFTNFWNMGGLWTAGLNVCFALFVAFFILKFRGG